jgi:hypothetical protein
LRKLEYCVNESPIKYQELKSLPFHNIGHVKLISTIVLGFGGIGKNYVIMKMKELGRNLEGEAPILHMVVSACATETWLAVLHFFGSFLFKRFLGSMTDFMRTELWIR